MLRCRGCCLIHGYLDEKLLHAEGNQWQTMNEGKSGLWHLFCRSTRRKFGACQASLHTGTSLRNGKQLPGSCCFELELHHTTNNDDNHDMNNNNNANHDTNHIGGTGCASSGCLKYNENSMAGLAM